MLNRLDENGFAPFHNIYWVKGRNELAPTLMQKKKNGKRKENEVGHRNKIQKSFKAF